MASVTLSNGKTATIPDGLADDAAASMISRLNAAAQSEDAQAQPTSTWGSVKSFLNKTPAEAVASADTASGGALSGAASWLNAKSGGALAPAANMAGNVAINVGTLPWDAPASISNAILRTAQNYGYAKDEPELPLEAPVFKQAFGVTQNTGPASGRIENALTIASTLGDSLLPSLFKGAAREGLSEGGSYAGQKVAEATDPRLAPALETGGAIAANALPVEQTASLLAKPLRGNDAANTLNAATETQKYVNANLQPGEEPLTRPPVTLGQVGGPFVKGLERMTGAVPILGMGVESARQNAEEGMVRGRDTAATEMGANPVDTTPTSPGSSLMFGTEQFQKNVAQRMDNVESALANNTQGPGGGAQLADVHGLLDTLQGMKTNTDAAGNVHPNVAPAIGQMIDNEIAHVNSARTPEDPALHAQLMNDANSLQAQINSPNTPAASLPALQAQYQQTVAQIDANLKVPFNVLRQMKTLQSYGVDNNGQPTLNGHMGGKVLDAYRDAIQAHADALDPQLGAQYQDLNGQYKTAMDATRGVGNKSEATLTNLVRSGMRSPSLVEPFVNTPAWGEASGNMIRTLGQKGDQFDPSGPQGFARTWDAVPAANKPAYTGGNPDTQEALDNVSQLARNFNIPTQSGGLTKSLAWLEVFNKALEHMGAVKLAGAAPLGYMAESMPAIRALAGRPQPYFRSLQQNLPALAAVARNQQQQPPQQLP